MTVFLTISFVLEVTVWGEPLVHSNEDDDHESVENEPGDHEAPAPLGTGCTDDGEEIHDDRGQTKSRDAELKEKNCAILLFFYINS